MMAQDKAEVGLMTLTEQSQNSQLKDEAARCRTELLTLKGLFQGSILSKYEISFGRRRTDYQLINCHLK